MIRLAHVADIHLGARLRGLPDYPGCPAVDPVGAAFDAVDALVRRLLDGGYDGVLLAGDVFDRHETDDRVLARAQSALTDLHDAGIPVALAWGNHDAESPLPARLRLPPTCWAAPAATAATHHWPDLGIAVHARSIADRDETRDVAADYPPSHPELRDIGLLHTSLTGDHSRRPCAPTTPLALAEHGYDYWALGHVHRRTIVRADPLITYPGSAHPARRTEFGPHGFLEVRCADTITVHPVDTSPVRRELLTATTEAEIAARFAAWTAPASTVVWTLSGPAHLLAPARELAREHPGFAVA